ncbi:MAG TPA: beta-galactosidase, partial [Spirochaetia bacterium]|nr:beta-galactosidase [Spirochaetia bacterium]
MASHRLPLTDRPKVIVRGTIPQGGTSPSGEAFTVNNYFIERNGRPFYAVAGEFHYSRYDQRFWEESLAKIQAGGVNLVSTYVFWNHHEEVQGEFEWSGRKDLRRFLELCALRGLKAIVRIGPFCHGEVRNGGFPDWVYGQPFEARSNDEGYLVLVRRLYAQIADQIRGLFLQDGGPILAIQIENEYQHSAAPWETTTATGKDWLPGGRDGRDHMLKLKQIARSVGMAAPFWTATAWGGACVPLPEALPLWGGYAYQPWLFYGDVKEHPATPEFLFRDHHNNHKPKTYNFEPAYAPEDYPYSCCEMGGGMQVWYPYRFTVPPASVEAMAIVKAAGGCNFLGYYMYHGGTNPTGK